MRKSSQLTENQTNVENEAQMEPEEKKCRPNNKMSNIATLDNDTMVEVFKYLNYYQLAKNSLVSNRFRHLVQTHRHKLALLYVQSINMLSSRIVPAAIKIFEIQLSHKAYDEWVILNNYLKEVPFKDQVVGKQSRQNILNSYQLSAYVYYEDPNHRTRNDEISVFSADTEVNHENWPIFQHFVRLATDPFIYIDRMRFTDQNEVLNLLAGAFNADRRLQCNELTFHLRDNCQKSLTLAKHHVCCNQFFIYYEGALNQDETLFDLVVTGARCTSSIKLVDYDLSKSIVDLVEKFMALKNSDEYHFVKSVESGIKYGAVEVLKRNYEDFIVKEERGHYNTTYVFEFVNENIGKKSQLSTHGYSYGYFRFLFS